MLFFPCHFLPHVPGHGRPHESHDAHSIPRLSSRRHESDKRLQHPQTPASSTSSQPTSHNRIPTKVTISGTHPRLKTPSDTFSIVLHAFRHVQHRPPRVQHLPQHLVHVSKPPSASASCCCTAASLPKLATRKTIFELFERTLPVGVGRRRLEG